MVCDAHEGCTTWLSTQQKAWLKTTFSCSQLLDFSFFLHCTTELKFAKSLNNSISSHQAVYLKFRSSLFRLFLKNKQTKLLQLFEEQRPNSALFLLLGMQLKAIFFCTCMVFLGIIACSWFSFSVGTGMFSFSASFMCFSTHFCCFFFRPVFLHQCISCFIVIFLCVSGYTLCLNA